MPVRGIFSPLNGNREGHSLLQGRPQRLLQAHESSGQTEDNYPVLVFVPSSSLALGTLGGTSHIYEFASDQSYWNHINPYPPKSAHRRLQDFLTDRRLYVLCERKGESVCEVAYFGPGVERRTWTPAVCGLTDELHRKLSVGCCYNQAR